MKLNEHPLFNMIAENDIQNLFASSSVIIKDYEEGEDIIKIGDNTDVLGIVLNGAVHIEKEDIYGNREIFASIKEGELFNEAFAFSDADKMTVNIRSASKTEVILIPSKTVTSYPQLSRNLLYLMAEKMYIFARRIEVISRRKTRDKLLTYLKQLKDKYNSSSFDIPFDRQGLADYLCVDRSGLSVEIHKLIREKVIKAKDNHFTLLNIN